MTVSIEQMTTALESTFVAHTAAGEIALTLVEAREAPRRGIPAQFRTPMTLILAGPADPVLYDDHYFLDHPVLGRHQWFMSPIMSTAPGAGPARQRYQIIFM
jgi:hypothetical protein